MKSVVTVPSTFHQLLPAISLCLDFILRRLNLRFPFSLCFHREKQSPWQCLIIFTQISVLDFPEITLTFFTFSLFAQIIDGFWKKKKMNNGIKSSPTSKYARKCAKNTYLAICNTIPFLYLKLLNLKKIFLATCLAMIFMRVILVSFFHYFSLVLTSIKKYRLRLHPIILVIHITSFPLRS